MVTGQFYHFYLRILNMNRGSLHITSFRRIHFSVFRYRWTKHGLTGSKNFRSFRWTGSQVTPGHASYLVRVTLTAKLINLWASFPDQIGICIVGFCRGRITGAGTRTSNILNPHVTLGPGIEPGPQRWEASVFTTAPFLLPYSPTPLKSRECLAESDLDLLWIGYFDVGYFHIRRVGATAKVAQ